MGLFNLFKPAQTVLVVDAVSLNESLGMKGKIPPRNQLQILRRLSRFAQREKIKVVAVLAGSPLNKAPAGKKFEDVTVLYSKSIEAHAGFLAKTVGSKGAGAVLVTGNPEAEKLLGNSARKMRVGTFRKAFDIGGDFEPAERGGNNARSPRPPRKNRPRQPAEPKQDRPPRQDRPPKQASEADAINELIDLVD